MERKFRITQGRYDERELKREFWRFSNENRVFASISGSGDTLTFFSIDQYTMPTQDQLELFLKSQGLTVIHMIADSE